VGSIVRTWPAFIGGSSAKRTLKLWPLGLSQSLPATGAPSGLNHCRPVSATGPPRQPRPRLREPGRPEHRRPGLQHGHAPRHEQAGEKVALLTPAQGEDVRTAARPVTGLVATRADLNLVKFENIARSLPLLGLAHSSSPGAALDYRFLLNVHQRTIGKVKFS
jgi:hypothetical protein